MRQLRRPRNSGVQLREIDHPYSLFALGGRLSRDKLNSRLAHARRQMACEGSCGLRRDPADPAARGAAGGGPPPSSILRPVAEELHRSCAPSAGVQAEHTMRKMLSRIAAAVKAAKAKAGEGAAGGGEAARLASWVKRNASLGPVTKELLVPAGSRAAAMDRDVLGDALGRADRHRMQEAVASLLGLVPMSSTPQAS